MSKVDTIQAEPRNAQIRALAGRLRRAVVGAVVGSGRRAARIQSGVLRFQMSTLRSMEQQVQASLAIQRVTADVGFELLTAWQGRLIRRFDQWAQSEH